MTANKVLDSTQRALWDARLQIAQLEKDIKIQQSMYEALLRQAKVSIDKEIAMKEHFRFRARGVYFGVPLYLIPAATKDADKPIMTWQIPTWMTERLPEA